MDLEAFRSALLARQREAARCARARLRGEDADESRLDELDARLFSQEQTHQLAEDLFAAHGGSTRLSARSRLALALTWGPVSRLRPLDRALSRALRAGQQAEAHDIADQIETRIAHEGPPSASASSPGAHRKNAGDRGSERVEPRWDYLALSGLTRGEDLGILESGARSLLEGSAIFVEEILERRKETSTEERSAEEMKRRAVRAHGRSGEPGPTVDASPSSRTSPTASRRLGTIPGGAGAASRHPRSFEGCLEILMDDGNPAGDSPDPASIRKAVQEAAEGLGLGRRLPPVGFAEVIEPAPVVLEEDPPESVSLLLPQRAGRSALAQGLDAGGRALEASLRSAALCREHRVASDRAVGFAIGALFSSLAGKHASIHRDRGTEFRRALGREILAARLAANLFIARTAVLSGRPAAPTCTQAAEEAVHRPLRAPLLPFEDEPLLDSADRLRGTMLLTGLRERFRTRFGNLWYREKAVGRILEEICEPGGSIVAAEIATGLSLSAPRAESLLDTWREERRRLE